MLETTKPETTFCADAFVAKARGEVTFDRNAYAQESLAKEFEGQGMSEHCANVRSMVIVFVG